MLPPKQALVLQVELTLAFVAAKTVTGTSGGADVSLVTAKTVTGTSGGADISLVTAKTVTGTSGEADISLALLPKQALVLQVELTIASHYCQNSNWYFRWS